MTDHTVAGPCKKARAAQDCQEKKNSRCQTESTERVNIIVVVVVVVVVV